VISGMGDSVERSDVDKWPFERSCPLDPPARLAELREAEPISRVRMWNGTDAWLATRYADVRSLLGNHAQVSSDTTREGFPHPSESAAQRRGSQRSFNRMDPPAHDAHRFMLTADFMVRRVRALKPFLDQLVEEAFQRMEGLSRPVDLVAAFAQPVPAGMITVLLDLPAGRAAWFQDRINTWMALDTPSALAQEAGQDVLDYFDDLIGERISGEGDDLVSRLIRDHLLTGDLTRLELQHMLHLLLVGGFDTTANMIALGTLTFLEHPDQRDAIVADPDLVPGAVEELLRYLSVAHHVGFRLAIDEVEVGGKCIHAGDGVIAPIMAANRDPRVFPDPDKFDVRRDARGHLAFGYGVHQCLGQALARVELQAVFAKLFQRFPNLELAVPMEELRFTDAIIYGVEELPVTWCGDAGE
jgi:cytochrome P450